MELTGQRVGFAMTGSYCTFDKVLPAVSELAAQGALVTPILSYNASNFDTRFMKAEELKSFLKTATGAAVLDNIVEVEPIGPKKLLDMLIIAPCTGNTLAKLALGITDTPVLLAAKSNLRNGRPVLIAVSSNDMLGANAKNMGLLLNTRNIYFVPYRQDDSAGKCTSVVADMSLIKKAAEMALDSKQLQPVMLSPH